MIGVDSDDGRWPGVATPLDAIGNSRRARRRPDPAPPPATLAGPNLVEIAHARYHGLTKE